MEPNQPLTPLQEQAKLLTRAAKALTENAESKSKEQIDAEIGFIEILLNDLRKHLDDIEPPTE